MPGWRRTTVARSMPRAPSGTSRSRLMTGPPGSGTSQGRRHSRAPDAREPRRPVPLYPRRPDHRGPPGADARVPRHRRERHRHRQARHALQGGRRLGLPRDQDQAAPAATRYGPVPRLPAARARDRAHGGERARRQAGRHSRRAGAAHPRHRRCPVLSTRTTRPRSPRPGRPSTSSPHRGIPTRRLRPGPGSTASTARSAAGARTLRWEERHDNPARQPRSSRRHGALANGGDRHRRALPPSGARGPGVRGQSPAGLQPPGPPLHARRCRAAREHPAHDRLGRPDTASGVAR